MSRFSRQVVTLHISSIIHPDKVTNVYILGQEWQHQQLVTICRESNNARWIQSDIVYCVTGSFAWPLYSIGMRRSVGDRHGAGASTVRTPSLVSDGRTWSTSTPFGSEYWRTYIWRLMSPASLFSSCSACTCQQSTPVAYQLSTLSK